MKLLKYIFLLLPFATFAQSGTVHTGRVNINNGKIEPTERLYVNGAARFTGAIQLPLTSGLLSVNGSGIIGVTPSSGLLPAIGASNTVLTSNGSSPSYNLIVNANIASGAAISALKLIDGSITDTELGYINTLTSNAQTQINTKFTLPSLTSGSVLFSNGSTITQDNANFFVDDANNRLGIGTNVPISPLTVNGTNGIYARSNGTTTGIIFDDLSVADGSTPMSGIVASGGAFTIVRGNRNASTGRLTSSSSSMTILTNGNIGINRAVPSEKLDILGNQKITGTMFFIRPDDVTQALAIAATPSYSTIQALVGRLDIVSSGALNNNATSGHFFNDATGSVNYMNINTSGDLANTGLINGIKFWRNGSNNTGNIGIGVNSINAITTGMRNIALGDSASRLNTTGSQNTALGYRAMENNTTGGFNVAIGGNAGRSANDGLSNNTYLNYNGSGVTTGNNVFIGDGSAVRIRANSTGDVGINTGTNTLLATGGGLDIASGLLTEVGGANTNSSSGLRSDATTKVLRKGAVHYTNAEEPLAILMASSTATGGIVYVGGGSSVMNASTQVRFYTAANNTTTTGTERMRLDSLGRLSLNTASPAYTLDVNGDFRVNGGSAARFWRTDLATQGLTINAGTSNNFITAVNGGLILGSSGSMINLDAANGHNFRNAAGSTTYMSISTAGNVNILGSTTSTRYVSSGSAPSIAAGAGAGTTPTISIAGRDNDFSISLTTGTTPTGTNAIIATVTYAGGAYTNGSIPTCTASVGAGTTFNAQALTGATQVSADGTTTTMVLYSGTSALAASTAYKWNCHSGGY